MNTTITGRKAEAAVAEYLTRNGYKIIALNWRSRWCEIDIVAQKNKRIYFVEVKFRRSEDWGDGLSYITPKKLRQMKFASEYWCAKNNWQGDCALAGASVNAELKIENFIEDLF